MLKHKETEERSSSTCCMLLLLWNIWVHAVWNWFTEHHAFLWDRDWSISSECQVEEEQNVTKVKESW